MAGLLVDELLTITDKEVFDAYQCAPLKLKVDILLYILQLAKFLGANAYQACVWCEIQGNVDLCFRAYMIDCV